MLPPRPTADRGSYIDFLVLVADATALPASPFEDQHFNPAVLVVGPDTPATFMAELAARQAQFIVSLGDRAHFGWLDGLPGQLRGTWFHLDHGRDLTASVAEALFWRAVRHPPAGTAAEPLISLFTPAYKSGSKILVPYKSLLAQAYPTWEWVIYDDSPPEHTETWELLSQLRSADPRIRLLRADRNDGFIGSVKWKACNAAAGELLVELDHDDTLTPDALSLLRDAAVAHPDAGFFYSDVVELYEGTNRSVVYGDTWGFGHGSHYHTLLDGAWVTAASAAHLNYKTMRHIVGVPNHVRAWRRAAYHAVGGHTRGLPVADDYDLILRTLFRFPAVHLKHMTYVQWRLHDGGTFTFKRNSLIQRMVQVVREQLNSSIADALQAAGMEGGAGYGRWTYITLFQDWRPQRMQLAREYHRPTAAAPAGQPRISVVLATHNASEASLLRAIASVRAQAYPNWDLILVGDNCPMLSAFMETHKQLAVELAAGGHDVRWFNLQQDTPPHGIHAALNYGLKALAPSHWIAYLESGDEWRPSHLSSLMALVQEEPRRTFAFSSLAAGGGGVLLCTEPKLYRVSTSTLLHHRSLVEKYGAWRSQEDAGVAHNYELVSRWTRGGERWGASLQPTAILHGLSQEGLQSLQRAYD